MPSRSFTCPHCDAAVPARAAACPECGSDARTGWSDDADAWAGDLPAGYDDDADDEFDEQAFLRAEGLLDEPAGIQWDATKIVALVLVACVLAWIVLR